MTSFTMRASLTLLACGLVLSCASHAPPAADPPVTAPAPAAPEELCRRIAADIEALRGFPQLADFRAERDRQGCTIRYQYRCLPPTGRGGWTSAVPNPDPDGVWFYVCLWDPNDPDAANAQINTQPVIPTWHIGGRRVTFLILEGERVPTVTSELMRILTKHGMR
jgi:hypothetical protein